MGYKNNPSLWAVKMEKNEAYAEIAKETSDEHKDLLEKINVVGVGAGNKIKDGEDTGEPCITVLVSRRVPESELSSKDLVEPTIKGYKTDVIETGEILAGTHESMQGELDQGYEIQTLRQKIRPVMGGFSVGHYQITAGTIATCVYPMEPFPCVPQRYFILSNNHVLANSNNARFGDPIIQPGRYDGGVVPRDIVAKLYRWVPIKFKTASTTPINYVDAAIAEGDFHNLNREVYWIGYVTQVNSRPRVGDIVQKTGRTTNYSTGKIMALHATVDVNYGGGRVARFADQIVTSNMSAGGDSGSLVCDIKEGVVGLLFAGSSRVTIVNSILHVQRLLGIRLHP